MADDVGNALASPEAVVGKQQLSESVANHLREQILSGRLQPGELLRIDAIARELEVSTTPVREGLLLQSESFVRLMPRRGFIVNSFSKGDLTDLFWAQATVGAERNGADPVNHVLPAWDLLTGAYAAFALLAAERQRTRTGKGQEVTVPLSDVALAALGHKDRSPKH